MGGVTTVPAGQNAADQQDSPDDPDHRPGQPKFVARLVRALMSSGLATGMSQVTLIVLLTMGVNPTVSSAAAFVAGAIPNYFVARRWAWNRKGKPDVKRELLPYLFVIALGGIASMTLTTIAGWITEPLRIEGFVRVIVLDVAFLSSYALVFLIKFTLLDRFVYSKLDAPKAGKSEPAEVQAQVA
ncbi:putative flippase GtrA (transmembrane translocase of bactoprenol-linked glucose) [Prauserella aidingensis]|uniref:GtrA family protein n=1 Tax=Prauserella aidingensis TaxID=387890 RepID=UPI003556DACE|nr:putative flippase GtrA (transmembrane translocase of bactoprenol-linked glucose) [Prauserella aidingensis]